MNDYWYLIRCFVINMMDCWLNSHAWQFWESFGLVVMLPNFHQNCGLKNLLHVYMYLILEYNPSRMNDETSSIM